MFAAAILALGTGAKGVFGYWKGGGDLSTNFDIYMAARREGHTPQQSAKRTHTGRWADEAGFKTVRVVSETESVVQVEFTP